MPFFSLYLHSFGICLVRETDIVALPLLLYLLKNNDNWIIITMNNETYIWNRFLAALNVLYIFYFFGLLLLLLLLFVAFIVVVILLMFYLCFACNTLTPMENKIAMETNQRTGTVAIINYFLY